MAKWHHIGYKTQTRGRVPVRTKVENPGGAGSVNEITQFLTDTFKIEELSRKVAPVSAYAFETLQRMRIACSICGKPSTRYVGKQGFCSTHKEEARVAQRSWRSNPQRGRPF
jgi:hypothetical protein